MTKEIDTIAGVERIYKYSEYGQIIRYTEKNLSTSNEKYSVYYVYNTLGQLTKETHTMGDVSYTYQYTYDSEGKLTKTAVVPNEGSFVSQRIDYDSLGRIQKIYTKENEDIPNAVTYQITYEDDSSRVERWYAYGGFFDNKYDYFYDKNGNITEIYVDTDEDTYEISYEYDSLGQLVRVNDPSLGTAGETWIYSYDLGGNITSKSRYAYTTGDLGTVLETITYTYGDATWGDLLTEYNGQEITYDQIGNPLTDGTWSYTWEMGRQLATQSNGNTTWNYDYDASGQRVTRTDGNTTYEYGYYGSSLVYEKITQGNTVVAEMYITYGEAGPLYIEYNGTIYYYILNGQGDVVGLAEWDVPQAVIYTYNAWGEIESVSGTKASTLGMHNPLRYRGYVYDTETELYYLNSRYYNPEWGRFVNADDISFLGATGTLLSYNLFAYCENNPINAIDENGYFSIPRTVISVPLDMGFMAISPYLAPVKMVAKKYAGLALKSKLSVPLVNLLKSVVKISTKILNTVKNIVNKLPIWGKAWARMINVTKISHSLAGMTTSIAFNNFLKIIVPNIDVFLSVGGFIAGVLDYVSDKTLDNKITFPFIK